MNNSYAAHNCSVKFTHTKFRLNRDPILTLDALVWRNFDPWFFTTVDVTHTGNPRVYYPSNAGMVCYGAVDLLGPDSEA